MRRKDNRFSKRSIVHISAIPLNCLTSINDQDWKLRVNEIGSTLPAWFEDERQLWLDRCLDKTKSVVNLWIKEGVKGDLNLQFTTVQDLGQLQSIEGYLRLSYCSKLASLGKLQSVEGNLSLFACSKLASLGQLQSVGGDLDLRSTAIKDLPENLVVKGNVYK